MFETHTDKYFSLIDRFDCFLASDAKVQKPAELPEKSKDGGEVRCFSLYAMSVGYGLMYTCLYDYGARTCVLSVP